MLTTTTSANGPPLLLYLLERRVGAVRMRDTLSFLFIGFAVIGLVSLAVGAADVAVPEGAVARRAARRRRRSATSPGGRCSRGSPRAGTSG